MSPVNLEQVRRHLEVASLKNHEVVKPVLSQSVMSSLGETPVPTERGPTIKSGALCFL